MKKKNFAALWLYMTYKRLCKKHSFLIILLIIPLILPLANMVMQGESGVLKIAVTYEGDRNPGAEAVIEKLKGEKSVLLYKQYETPQKAREAVENGEADSAWIFTENFSDAVQNYARRKRSAPLVTVLQRETSVPLNLACEKLYGAVYPQISYAIYENFTEKSFSPSAAKAAKDYYENAARGRNVIQTEKLHASESASETNYLTAPLRGLLSVLVLLSALAATMYYLEDKEKGKFDWLTGEKSVFPAAGMCLAASSLAGAAVLLAIYAGGIYTAFWREVSAMILFVLSSAVFGTFFAAFFKSTVRFGAFLPIIIIGGIALSPIFFHVKAMPLLRVCLPTTYYLKAIHNAEYLIYMVIYIVCVSGFTAATCALKNFLKKSL